MPVKKNSLSNHNRQYASFLKGIKLWGLGLQESRSFLDRGAYAELEKGRLIRRITTEYRLLEASSNFFNVVAKLRLSVEDRKGGPTPPAIIVECAYEAHFHCDNCKITRELAERFTESEFRLVVWPYFRQFVNDITGKMWIEPILIPFSAVS